MSKRAIMIETPDGTAHAGVFTPPATGSVPREEQPGVILYMDAFGPRPALDAMGERLASAGYLVLIPDLFYRHGRYGPYDPLTAFTNEASRNEIMGMIHGTTQAMTESDSASFVEALVGEGAGGTIGVVGYCMGGARALTAAEAYPERIGAIASFHGGNLASDAPDSPHRRVASLRGRVYVGAAAVDRSFPPEQSTRLAAALREAEIDHTIENYVGVAHGWAVADHSVYNEAGAERHWKRLFTFFGETLKAA